MASNQYSSGPSTESGSRGRDVRPTVSVILPAYNEDVVLERTLERVCTHMDGIADRYRWEVVVVNDGSTDGTQALAEAFAARRPEVRIVRHHTNFNLGQALRSAFNTCSGDYVVTLDTDLSYDPSHITRLLDKIVETRAKIVIATPYGPGGQATAVPTARLILSRGANRLLGWAAADDLTTITGVVRAYDRVFLSSLSLTSLSAEINTEIIYKAQLLGAQIVEIPGHLDWTEQNALGPGRMSSMKVGRAIVAQGFNGFIFRPFSFFTIPGIALGLVAIYTLALAAIRWIDLYDEVPGSAWTRIGESAGAAFDAVPHTFIIGGISLILSVQLISLGIIATQAKRYFEELFALGTNVLRYFRLDPELFEPQSRSLWDQPMVGGGPNDDTTVDQPFTDPATTSGRRGG